MYRVSFVGVEDGRSLPLWDGPMELREDQGRMALALGVLEDYFARGRAIEGLIPTPVEGTPFQRRVWSVLETIPHGEVRSYGWVAERIGMPRASRAVGAANGANPIPIIVPCHRVINADGRIGGYSGGVSIKRKLLELEGLDVDSRGYVSPRSISSP